MKSLTRSEVIHRLRCHFLTLVDDEHSVCDVAARLGVFCSGYRQWTDRELREKFSWIAGPRPRLERAQLEEIIDCYKLARKQALDVPLCCDAQKLDRDSCLGWDEFTEVDLAQHHKELLGEEVSVRAD